RRAGRLLGSDGSGGIIFASPQVGRGAVPLMGTFGSGRDGGVIGAVHVVRFGARRALGASRHRSGGRLFTTVPGTGRCRRHRGSRGRTHVELLIMGRFRPHDVTISTRWVIRSLLVDTLTASSSGAASGPAPWRCGPTGRWSPRRRCGPG